MGDLYSKQQRQLQHQHDTRNLADRIQQIIVEKLGGIITPEEYGAMLMNREA